jgi:membrane associated rhomboid family serine protease
MSIYDRDYIRQDDHRPRSGGPSTWSVVIWLLVVNVAVFVLNNLIFYAPNRDLFGLSIRALESFRIWTPLTYQFVHASPWHLLGNMLGLLFLGRMLLEMTGPRQVLRLYILGGLGGGLLQLLYNGSIGPDSIIIGASASVLAIVFAVATLIPYRSITMLLFFVIPVTLTMKQVAYLIIAMNAFTFLFSFGATGDGVAVMAHFGGMLTGWAFIRYGFHHSKKPSVARTAKASRDKKKAFGIRVIRDAEEAATDRGAGDSASDKRKPFVTSDVDAILDKINEHGFQSLSDAERQVLEQSSRKLSDRIDRNS